VDLVRVTRASRNSVENHQFSSVDNPGAQSVAGPL